MHYHFLKQSALSLGALLLLNSCIDNNYDLSDIDTTTKLQVNDLTIPLNLKDIDLESVIDVDDNDPDAAIKVMNINGQRVYAVEKGGTFEAQPVKIKKIEAPAPKDVPNIVTHINSSNPSQSRRRLPAGSLGFTLTRNTTDFTYNVGSDVAIDASISSVEDVAFDNNQPIKIHITLEAPQLSAVVDHVGVKDLELIIPNGAVATCGNAKSNNGIIKIEDYTSSNSKIELDVVITEMNFANNPKYDSKKGMVVKNGKFDFSESVGFNAGTFIVYPSASAATASIPSSIDFVGRFDISSFVVDEFTGVIDYPINMDEIPSVNLGDLPDFLAGDETNIIIANPQLYLEANNPVGQYGVGAVTGLSISALRDNGMQTPTQVMPEFTIGQDGRTMMRVLLCPDPSASSVNPDFKNATSYKFPGMSKILSGPGIPNSLEVKLESSALAHPKVFGNAKNFPLQQPLDAITGKYTFFTPFALADGSTIVYSKSLDGWNDADVDKIEISNLKIHAEATTSVPCAVKLVVYPLDKFGNKMENIRGEAAIPANCADYPFDIILSGDIKNLDGIYFIATATDFNGHALSPEQTIHLGNIRVSVSGSYTTDF